MTKTMKGTLWGGVMVAAFLLFGTTPARAVPIISIDLDPGTGGIQSTLTVDPGDTFMVDVVFTGFGVEEFDALLFAVDFNDLGAVLGLVTPGGGVTDGNPTAGDLVDAAGTWVDILGMGLFLTSGDALTSVNPVAFGQSLTGGFTATSGAIVIGNIFLPIPLDGTLTIFSLTLTALAAGTSNIIPNGGGSDIRVGVTRNNIAVPFTLEGSTVTVTPEPSTMLLLGSGLAGLGFFRRRRKDRRTPSIA